MFDKLKMLKQAKDMQKKMAEITTEVDYNGIQISINGKQEILDLKISEVLFEDPEKLTRFMKDGMNKAVKDSQRDMAKQMQGEMGGMFGM